MVILNQLSAEVNSTEPEFILLKPSPARLVHTYSWKVLTKMVDEILWSLLLQSCFKTLLLENVDIKVVEEISSM